MAAYSLWNINFRDMFETCYNSRILVSILIKKIYKNWILLYIINSDVTIARVIYLREVWGHSPPRNFFIIVQFNVFL